MRDAVLIPVLVLLMVAILAPEAHAGEIHSVGVSRIRSAPGEVFLAKRGLGPDTDGRIRMELTNTVSAPVREVLGQRDENSGPGFMDPWIDRASKTSATLNCGSDNTIDAAGTLVLAAGDAAGTIFPTVTGVPNIVIESIRFGVIDFGGTYPGTMYVDFWEEIGPDEWEFVVGGEIPILADPGIEGVIYNVDLTVLELVVGTDMMVLLYDANPGAGLILPAGDSSQSCFDGSNFCSVLLPDGGAGLFLYGIVDAVACPGGVNNIQLFDLVLEVDYFLDSPTDTPTRAGGYALYDAQPNPFNPRTSIQYSIPEATSVSLKIYDLAGRLVQTLVDEHQVAGDHTMPWDGRTQEGSAVASGVYLYRLETPGFEETKRMILLK